MRRPIATQRPGGQPSGAVVVPIVEFVGSGPARELADRVKRLSWLRRKALMRSWRSPAADPPGGRFTPR